MDPEGIVSVHIDNRYLSLVKGQVSGIKRNIFFSFQVRTKDRTFESVSHLINHHRETGRPIISAESALRLITPVPPENHRKF